MSLSCADGLEHADLAASLAYSGEHRVRDPERGDHERDEAHAAEHDLDDVNIPFDVRDEALGSAGGVAERG